ncbi:MAG TPA: hypothetical protein EYM77_05065 [Dehalococcoidia bacterium]|nr:hypothetical protein [Dehalococcoidia bacterium]
MKRLLIIRALVILLTIFAACGSDDEVVAEINEVSYTATDYHFEGSQFLPSGMTELTLVNQGMELHHQQLLTLPEGMTVDDLMAGLMSGEEGPPPPGVDAARGVGALNPGLSGNVTLNLTPGNYVVLCLVPNAEGAPHVALGMVKPITVIESGAPPVAEPEADLTIGMVDFGFAPSTAISSGVQNIRVTNQGEQDHEAFPIMLNPGATVEDFWAPLSQEHLPVRRQGKDLAASRR